MQILGEEKCGFCKKCVKCDLNVIDEVDENHINEKERRERADTFRNLCFLCHISESIGTFFFEKSKWKVKILAKMREKSERFCKKRSIGND